MTYEEQVRAKYTAEQLDDMLAAGHAFKNPDGDPSYPIGDVQDLKRAIKAVGRGNADHDSIRKYVIGRAKDLGESALIPDNWNSDGSLSDEEKALPKSWQKRDADMTYNDAQSIVQAAIIESLSTSTSWKSDDDDSYVYVQDMTDEWVVYSIDWNGPMYKVTYEVDGSGKVTLGDPQEVQRVTSYEPAPRSRVSATLTPKGFVALHEWRTPCDALFQVRDAAADNTAHFVGYPSTTETGYDVVDFLGAYTETIRGGAFNKTLRESDSIPLLSDHMGVPMASTGSGTSRLAEDAVGLRNEADLDRRQSITNDVCIAMERGDLTKMSFAFSAVRQDWSEDYTQRSVAEVRLYDTSVVTFPANPTTTAALRSEMRQAMGREGVGLLWSVRSALDQLAEKRELPSDSEPVVEAALKALQAADDAIVSRYGCQGRGRTLIVAGILNDLLTEVRAGKALSSAKETLLRQALEALQEADTQLGRATSSVQSVVDTASKPKTDTNEGDPKNTTGGADAGGQTTGASGASGAGVTSLNPADGAGPRSKPLPKSVRDTQKLAARLRGWS
jgi:HK97 family phage prohead protease